MMLKNVMHRNVTRCATFLMLVFLFVTPEWQYLRAQGDAPAAGGFILPLKDKSVRFAVIGDFGTGEKAQYELAAAMEKYRAKFPFDFVVTLGDNIYGGHRPSDFERKF